MPRENISTLSTLARYSLSTPLTFKGLIWSRVSSQSNRCEVLNLCFSHSPRDQLLVGGKHTNILIHSLPSFKWSLAFCVLNHSKCKRMTMN